MGITHTSQGPRKPHGSQQRNNGFSETYLSGKEKQGTGDDYVVQMGENIENKHIIMFKYQVFWKIGIHIYLGRLT